MWHRIVDADREITAFKPIRLPGKKMQCIVPAWQYKRYGSNDDFMIVKRRLGKYRRRKQHLFHQEGE